MTRQEVACMVVFAWMLLLTVAILGSTAFMNGPAGIVLGAGIEGFCLGGFIASLAVLFCVAIRADS